MDLLKKVWKYKVLLIMLSFSVVYFVIFTYFPILNGLRISVIDYKLFGKSQFVGFNNYLEVLGDKYYWQSFYNTVIIGGGNLITSFVVSLIFALLLNEMRNKFAKKFVQTVVYMPYLFSWVIVGSIWLILLEPGNGFINEIIKQFGGKSVYLMAMPQYSRIIFIGINMWMQAGYGCILFLASIVGIDIQLYEASKIDGAGYLRQAFNITIPSLFDTMKVVFLLNLMGVLRIFDQVYVLKNPMISDQTEVIMTYTYTQGIERFRYSYASAMAFIVFFITLVLTLAVKNMMKYSAEQEG